MKLQLLENPRWPDSQKQQLRKLREEAESKLGRSYIWLATSGTTAAGSDSLKLVAHTESSLQASAAAINQFFNVSSSDRWLKTLPGHHVGGLGISIRAQLSGSEVIEVPEERKWNASGFAQKLSSEKITLTSLVPTQVFDLVKEGIKAPSSVRTVFVGGGAISEALMSEFKSLGWPAFETYGMTETASMVAVKKDSAFEALPHAEVSVSAQGLIQVRSSSLFSAYAQIRNGSTEVWSPIQNHFFLTEDSGAMVASNLFKVFGRASDTFKIGGELTNLQRLQQLLEEACRDLNLSPKSFVLLRQADERLENHISLVYELDVRSGKEALMNQYHSKVSPFEKIRKTYEVSKIPRSDLGKVLTGSLKAQLTE